MSDTGELANLASPFLLPLAQRVKVKGIEFDEEFVAELISKYFINRDQANEPRLSDALQIYIAFRHLDMDRLSPFRGLKIIGENEHKRSMRIVTPELLLQVKQRLLFRLKPYKLIGLIQLNTGMRLSEPVFARLDDLVLDHPIPHLWVRRNELSNRKTKSSIRAVPLVGSSLFAAQRLLEYAKAQGSEWLVPDYAHYHGSNSCSAILNKHLKDLDFRSHMFRHALIDRMKACNDIPTRLAESITGHYSGASEFNNYGTVGYTLEQKLEVLKRIAI